MIMTGSMWELDDTRGAIRVEDVYDTDLEDLWRACTDPERAARWIAQVAGEFRPGGILHATFTSTWTGSMRIDVCEAPHHLVLTQEPGTDEETVIEAWLSAEGDKSRLVVEERGLGNGVLHFHAAGWQVHLEDLGRSLETGAGAHPSGWSSSEPAPAWKKRWETLLPDYEAVRAG